MKKYAILALLSLSSFIQAQQDSSYYPNSNKNSSQDSRYHPAQTSKDVIDYSQPSNKNNQDESTQDKKSTPSQDTSKTEEKNDKEESKNKEDDSVKKEAEKPKSPHLFAGNVSLVSDYRFRGISQTMRRPAIQGGFDYSHVNGAYVGTWASNADGTTHYYNNTSMEWDFYGGYKGKFFPYFAPDFVYNIGLIYYYYPGGKTNTEESVRYNTGEFYIELAYKWFNIKYWQTLTDYFGINSDNTPFNWKKNLADKPKGSSRGSIYIEANATFNLYKKVCWPQLCLKGGKLSLLLHVSHQTVRHYEHLSYTDWRATLTQEFDWFNVFLSYVGTNARSDYFDVPDNSFHSDIRRLGAQEVVIGAIRTF